MLALVCSVSRCPSRSTTNAQGISSAAASSTRETTPQSRTAGCSSNTPSTSAGAIENPLYFIISLRRSTTKYNPCSLTRTTSPDQYHPSCITAAVASGDFQYPSMNCGPRITNSPSSPGATSFPFSSTTLHSVCATGPPIEPLL